MKIISFRAALARLRRKSNEELAHIIGMILPDVTKITVKQIPLKNLLKARKKRQSDRRER